ncbi:MAG: hypothetical protein WAO52_02250 [Prolixibacteraceae bacterium]
MKLLPALILLFSVLFSYRPFAQEISPEVARFEALAGASVAQEGCWSAFGNQAGLANIKQTVLAVSFQNRFLLDELSGRSGLLVWPVQSSVFALSVFQFGKTTFRQEQYGLAYARQMNTRFNFGFQFNYYRLYFSEENKFGSTPGVELGFQYSLNNQTVLGVHVRNPYRTAIKTQSANYYFTSGIVVGVLYRFSDSFRASSEFEYDFGKHVLYRTGLEYDILENLFLRAGVAGNPVQLSGGFGFHYNLFHIDLATSYHTVLGNSPSVSFQYQF